MRNKKLFIFISLALLLGGVIFYLKTQAYTPELTHPILTEEAVKFYNFFAERKITERELIELKRGAHDEDNMPRPINHFYDPVYNQGWQKEDVREFIEKFDERCLKEFPDLTQPYLKAKIENLSPEETFKTLFGDIEPLSAKNWAQNQEIQARYADYRGNRTWQRALDEYVKGDEKQAFYTLGFLFHLIEDVLVPAHTRADTHVGFCWKEEDPYEQWVHQYLQTNSWEIAEKLKNEGKGIPKFNNLDQIFDENARYSNGYFFSKDTILSERYQTPKISEILKISPTDHYGITKDSLGQLVYLAKLRKKPDGVIYYEIDDLVKSNNWSFLSRQAVLSGAGMLKLFFEEAEKIKKGEKEIKIVEGKSVLEYAFEKANQPLVYFLTSEKEETPQPLFSLAGFGHKISPYILGLGIKRFFEDASLTIKNAFSQFNPFKATVTPLPEFTEVKPSQTREPGQEQAQEQEKEQNTEVKPLQISEKEKEEIKKKELQEIIDDLLEQIDLVQAEINRLTKEKESQKIVEMPKKKPEEEIDEEELTKEESFKKQEEICSVNINTASKEELQKITGVGPVLAQRIIEARPFYSLNDLLKVSGIGPGTLAKIIAQGCAYASGYASASAGGAAGAGTGAGASSASAPSYPKILISEVQIEGENANHDFIELYNPNDFDADISRYKLRKRTSGGTEYSINVLPQGSIIPKKGYYLWASYEDANYPFSIDANTWTKENITENNSIALLTPDDTVISALAWGSSTNPFVEGTPFPNNPGKNQSLGRIWDEANGEYKNTGNNLNDFEIQIPTPKAQNQSPIPQPSTPSLTVVINEIAWMGTAASSNDEWIELHNTTKNEIDLTGWKLISLTDGSPDIVLSKTIPPLGFYLLERTTSTVTNVGEDQIYTGGLNNDPKCEILVLYDPNNNPIDQTVCREDSDKRYWPAGKASPDYITMERIDPRASGENSENWANNNGIIINGLDAAGNPIKGTPRAQNSVYQSLPPNPVSDLNIDSQNSYGNKITLTWSSSTDPDTLSENLSYFIYYSKNEADLNSTSTSHATTTATNLTISNLDYNSTYYFGVRVFDGQNYSSLATTTPYQIPSALINSAWPMFRANPQRSSQSAYLGPNATPTVGWVYSEESNPNNPDNNPLYTSPIIRPEGTIFSSVVYPPYKKGVLSLNSDGTKKWFEERDIDSPLALQPDGSVLADNISRVWSEDETAYYFSQNDTLYAFDKDGNKKWQRQFVFEDPQQFGCSSTTPSVLTPAVGKEGIIYAVVQNNSCTPDYKLDYLYVLSQEDGNDILPSVNLGGYNSSFPTVSVDNTVYIFNLTYPKYASGPTLWLKAVSNGQIQWEKSFDNNFKSLPIVDSQGNIYFSLGKKVYGFDKEGGEIWQIYLVNAPSNWEIVSDFLNGLVLSTDGTLYLSGRGAIFALK